MCNSYLKLLVSSLFCSHLQTCRFLHLSNRSELFTLQNKQRDSEEETQGLAGVVLHSLSAPLLPPDQHSWTAANSRPRSDICLGDAARSGRRCDMEHSQTGTQKICLKLWFDSLGGRVQKFTGPLDGFQNKEETSISDHHQHNRIFEGCRRSSFAV